MYFLWRQCVRFIHVFDVFRLHLRWGYDIRKPCFIVPEFLIGLLQIPVCEVVADKLWVSLGCLSCHLRYSIDLPQLSVCKEAVDKSQVF